MPWTTPAVALSTCPGAVVSSLMLRRHLTLQAAQLVLLLGLSRLRRSQSSPPARRPAPGVSRPRCAARLHARSRPRPPRPAGRCRSRPCEAATTPTARAPPPGPRRKPAPAAAIAHSMAGASPNQSSAAATMPCTRAAPPTISSSRSIRDWRRCRESGASRTRTVVRPQPSEEEVKPVSTPLADTAPDPRRHRHTADGAIAATRSASVSRGGWTAGWPDRRAGTSPPASPPPRQRSTSRGAGGSACHGQRQAACGPAARAEPHLLPVDRVGFDREDAAADRGAIRGAEPGHVKPGIGAAIEHDDVVGQIHVAVAVQPLRLNAVVVLSPHR